MIRRRFVCHFHWNDWRNVALGIALDFQSPNLEIHFWGGFFRIGWQGFDPDFRSYTIGRTYPIP